MNTSLISVQQLRMICRKLPGPRAEAICNAINKVCPGYGLNKMILHEFLANLVHESAEFMRYEENLNYSAERLMQVWPSRFRKLEDALPYAHHPQKLAMKVYAGRMGNIETWDGWDFRGSGPIQMTGRDNFIRFASWMDRKFQILKTEKEWARLVRSDHDAGMHSACWIFSIEKGLNGEAIKDNMWQIVKKINGGLNGYDDRMMYYELCKRYLL